MIVENDKYAKTGNKQTVISEILENLIEISRMKE